MTHPASARAIHRPAEPSPGRPDGNHGRFLVETGAVVARIFDLLEGSRFEPFAAEVAWGLVNGARRQPRR